MRIRKFLCIRFVIRKRVTMEEIIYGGAEMHDLMTTDLLSPRVVNQ